MKFSQIFPYIVATLVFFSILGVFIFYQFFLKKELKIITPKKGEVLRAGESYTIVWKARKIDKVDIILIKEEEPKKSKPIVENFPAKKGKYQWKIFAFEEKSDRYKIAICESPCKEGNKFDYSQGYFSIVGPRFVSCEQLEIENSWTFIPSDYPNLKRVFITTNTYTGNLRGLDGADEICQKEAEIKRLGGKWKAFLGDENISAIERLNLDGIFVLAQPQDGLPQDKIPAYFWKNFEDYLKKYSAGSEKLRNTVISAYQTLTPPFSKFYEEWNRLQENKSCLRLLGKDFEHFYNNLFILPHHLINPNNPEEMFLKEFFGKNIWVGRISPKESKSCINIFSDFSAKNPFSISFTVSCQNWTSQKEKIETLTQEEKERLRCYVGGVVRIEALGIGGLARIANVTKDTISSNIVGQPCSYSFHLLCIEQ